MTLGGMALAVGILVDDATVAIENIHRNLHQRKHLVRAILDGSAQIAVPAFVATICICIVFVPVVFISGAARYLFTPLALAVVFAMLTSYLLSRTLVPTMVHFLLAGEVERYGGVPDENDPHVRLLMSRSAEPRGWRRLARGRGGKLLLLVAAALAAVAWTCGAAPWLAQHANMLAQGALGLVAAIALGYLVICFHATFNRGFERLRLFYGGLLDWALEHTRLLVGGFGLLVVGSCGLWPHVGEDFFPAVDAGQLRLHVRCRPGTRIEETERHFAQVQDAIREVIPAIEIAMVIDNMGIPNSGINLSLSDGTVMSPADGEILVSLKENHGPTAAYMRRLRKELPRRFPDLVFFFAPSDIVTQVLNFGLSAPIDIQIGGPVRNAAQNLDLARRLQAEAATIPGVVDVHLQQVPETPDLRVGVDRTLASQLGMTQKDVASDLLISLSSSNQTSPNFWLNPQNGATYGIFVQTPQYAIDGIRALESTAISPAPSQTAAGAPQLLGNLATVGPGASPTNATHYNIKPTVDVLMAVQGSDLGSAAKALNGMLERYRKALPRGSELVLRGQIESMSTSFSGLGYGLVFAVMLVYLLMVINFQSWLDPLIILMALPGALAGILWVLWATHTTLSVPALMGSIMSIGVATANSILLVTFANEQRKLGMDARQAALSAGLTRLRPVIMTALAMIIGMLPMSLGLGEGGEQNAPLGKAVIGGLGLATFATLIFVPVVYSVLRRKPPVTQIEPELMS